jgi:integrase
MTFLRFAVLVAASTGLRRGELLALRWCDLDLDGATLCVAQVLEFVGKRLSFKEPKTKQSRRTIALSLALVEELQTYRARQATERLALGIGRDPARLVFTSIDGAPLRPDGVTWRFAKLVNQAGVRRISFHGLRHTHATDLLRAGVHSKIASERLGHSSVATTLDIYSHALPGLQEEAAQRIDAALRKVLSVT